MRKMTKIMILRTQNKCQKKIQIKLNNLPLNQKNSIVNPLLPKIKVRNKYILKSLNKIKLNN